MKKRTNLTRREFVALATTATPFVCAKKLFAAPITTQEVIERIKKNIGVEWKPDSVDGVKAGDPSTIARGIVTTSMATMAVLQQAVKAGANVVITAQPTFYGRADVPTPPPSRGAAPSAPISDPVFTAKQQFIDKNRLVVFRLSEHWKPRQPDPLVQGMAAAFGWSKYQTAGDPLLFEIPALKLDAMAGNVKNALRSRGGMRVIGDPGTMVQRVGLLPGTTPIQAALKMLPNVDVIIAGEVREWESVEYVRDKVFATEKKALVLVGRVVSEEPGMNVCANWLKTFVSDVPIRHLPAGDPYWRPS
jgi:putative NIF3 family GTP cyclohydrolase 1 type 2